MCSALALALWACPPPQPVADAGAPDAGPTASCDRERYLDRPDGVLDTRTGALWFRWSEPERYTPDEGAARCESLGGRLPTRAEFEALLGGLTGDGLCTLDPCAFEGVRCETFLTGSLNRATEGSWAIDTISGLTIAGELGPYLVRCVH